MRLADFLCETSQTSSSFKIGTSIASTVANRSVAENAPRLILFAMLASVYFSPCLAARSAGPSIQHGHALTRNGNGTASRPLGTLLDLLVPEGG
jgi:hypothetical protein